MKGFIFPGQGSQYKGMGKVILSKYEEGYSYLKEAQKILNMNLEYLLFEADDEVLKDTENATNNYSSNKLHSFQIFRKKWFNT